MGITKKQIKQLDKGKTTVRELFPDVFEEFTGWAKTNELDNGKYLAYFEKNILKYGFSDIGEWFVCEYKNQYNYNPSTKCPATDEEVKTALIEEAKKRGFKNSIFYNGKWTEIVKEKTTLDLLNEIIDASENNAYVRNKAKEVIELLTKDLTVNDAEIIKN
jgi:hypothetical protein